MMLHFGDSRDEVLQIALEEPLPDVEVSGALTALPSAAETETEARQ